MYIHYYDDKDDDEFLAYLLYLTFFRKTLPKEKAALGRSQDKARRTRTQMIELIWVADVLERGFI